VVEAAEQEVTSLKEFDHDCKKILWRAKVRIVYIPEAAPSRPPLRMVGLEIALAVRIAMTLLDLCSYLGLAAVGAITANLLLGMLIALRYSPKRLWPHRPINVFAIHQWTAYAAVALTLAHPVVLLFLHTPRFRLFDILFPVHSYLQPTINLIGALALYLVVVVFLSSLLRIWIGRRLWRILHYLVYPAAVLLFVHSILTDPNLKDGHPDFLDGGKIFVEIAAVLGLAAAVLRVHWRGRGFRPTPPHSAS
jgi:predicted ferric reductase